jgi:(R,R)-butanediol dehydrogenase / meso-butanediol dehydrogenase / diacetyl reductase
MHTMQFGDGVHMRGMVFKGDQKVELISIPDPEPGPDDVILEIKASGFCGADLKYFRDGHAAALEAYGYPPVEGIIIAGHEPCGVVAAVGSNVERSSFRVGSRVGVHHYDGCHYCDQCRSGWTQLCDEGPVVFGQTAHGAHAPYMKVPARCLVHLPDEVSFSAGAAIGCGTGTAYGALVRLDVSARDTLAVFGLGPVGQSAVQFAAAMGAQVIAVDIAEQRIARAREFGAAHVINSSKTDAVETIRELTGGKGVSLAMDCAGVLSARQAAVRSTAKWGKTALCGSGGEVTLEVMKDLISKQRTIIGSWTFSNIIMGECLRFVADHGVDVDKQFSHSWKLEEAQQAYEEFNKQTSGKAFFAF